MIFHIFWPLCDFKKSGFGVGGEEVMQRCMRVSSGEGGGRWNLNDGLLAGDEGELGGGWIKCECIGRQNVLC
jgi:hypothetical protein